MAQRIGGFDRLSDRDPVTDHCPVTELVEVPGVDPIKLHYGPHHRPFPFRSMRIPP